MWIESFSILDYKNEEANHYKFSEGINLISSENNSLGKSSVLKSLYFNLGFDIKHFPSNWDSRNMVFQLKCVINDEEYVITRKNNIFKIDNDDTPLNVKEYSNWLQDKLNINMQLPNVRTNELYEAYSSAIILPFYIDQDDSWNGALYKNVTDTVKQYSSMPSEIFKYLFNISDIEIQDLNNLIKSYQKEKNDTQTKINSLNLVIEDYQTEVSSVPSIDKNALEQEINSYLKILNDHNEKATKYKMNLINKQELLDQQKQDLSEIEKLLQMNKKRYDSIQSICTYCNSYLTQEQSLTRLNLSNNKFEMGASIILCK
ncbi:hypothetical protein GCM10028778_07900 [Barrientosiimonas marina]|uniref:DUF2326 domain-containing protein n=1 Tax=Lentibacillus kimchii TaxID=1542911 RepID=A0ABW2UZ98_9BACI